MTEYIWLSFAIALLGSIAAYVIHWMKVVQPKVDKSYPGYRVCWSPLAVFPLWVLYLWRNYRYWRSSPARGGTPLAHWFSGLISFTEYGNRALSPLEYAGSLHPMFLGYDWYRGYSLETTKGKYLFFTPWMWPQESRTPIFLYKGDGACLRVVWEFIFHVAFAKQDDL